VTLTADVRYVICRDVCILRRRWPSYRFLRERGRCGGSPTISRRVRQRAESLACRVEGASEREWRIFRALVRNRHEREQSCFFPLEQDQIDNDAMQGLTPTARGVQIKLKKSDQLKRPIAALKGVVVLGPGRVFEVTAPLTAKK